MDSFSGEIHGFLDYIFEEEEARTHIFETLIQEDHPSLFWGVLEGNVIGNAVLIGPLSLCNSNEYVNKWSVRTTRL